MTDTVVVDEEAWLLASAPRKPCQGNTFVTSWDDMRKK